MNKVFNLGEVNAELYNNGTTKGLVLKRKATINECKYILANIFYIDILDRDNMSKDIHNIITEERIKKEAEKLMDTLPCDEPKGLVYNTFKYAVKWTMENL